MKIFKVIFLNFLTYIFSEYILIRSVFLTFWIDNTFNDIYYNYIIFVAQLCICMYIFRSGMFIQYKYIDILIQYLFIINWIRLPQDLCDCRCWQIRCVLRRGTDVNSFLNFMALAGKVVRTPVLRWVLWLVQERKLCFLIDITTCTHVGAPFFKCVVSYMYGFMRMRMEPIR